MPNGSSMKSAAAALAMGTQDNSSMSSMAAGVSFGLEREVESGGKVSLLLLCLRLHVERRYKLQSSHIVVRYCAIDHDSHPGIRVGRRCHWLDIGGIRGARRKSTDVSLTLELHPTHAGSQRLPQRSRIIPFVMIDPVCGDYGSRAVGAALAMHENRTSRRVLQQRQNHVCFGLG